MEILRQAGERELTSGRGPTGVAAAAIYISSILGGERRTQREVAEVAGVTEVTIRNRYRDSPRSSTSRSSSNITTFLRDLLNSNDYIFRRKNLYLAGS